MAELTLHPDEVEAIRQLVCRVTVPIASNKNCDFPEPIGSATLLRDADRLFLITAAHVLEGEDGSTLFVSASRSSAPPLPLAPATVVRAKSPDAVDIAIIEVTNSNTKDCLFAGWGCVTLDSIGEASADGLFVLSGYPTERLSVDGATLWCTCITAITERLASTPKGTRDPVDKNRDLFFMYEPTGRFSDGDCGESPNLRGTSGGGVWEFSNVRPEGVWTAQKALKLIGVQSSARHFEWFRAHASWAIVEALREFGISKAD